MVRLGAIVLAVVVACAVTAASAASLAGPQALADLLRAAIAARDYEAIEAVINWDGAGKIKRRIVAFSVRRGLGRSVKSITVEAADGDAIAAVAERTGRRLNMPVSHKIRVVYDEPPVDGKPPTAVYIVGERPEGWRIALVVRVGSFDDD